MSPATSGISRAHEGAFRPTCGCGSRKRADSESGESPKKIRSTSRVLADLAGHYARIRPAAASVSTRHPAGGRGASRCYCSPALRGSESPAARCTGPHAGESTTSLDTASIVTRCRARNSEALLTKWALRSPRFDPRASMNGVGGVLASSSFPHYLKPGEIIPHRPGTSWPDAKTRIVVQLGLRTSGMQHRHPTPAVEASEGRSPLSVSATIAAESPSRRVSVARQPKLARTLIHNRPQVGHWIARKHDRRERICPKRG